MYKKIAAGALAVMLTLGSLGLPAAEGRIVLSGKDISVSAEDMKYGSYSYSILKDGTVEITGYDESGGTSAVIPSEIDGRKVTSIGWGAFQDCNGLTSVTIPNSISNIGNWAFYGCKGLTGIIIPNSVKIIDQHAFCKCTGLKSITIPSSVEKIGTYAFLEASGLSGINVDKNNKYYSSDSQGILYDKNKTKLIQCPRGIKSVTIPNSVKNISPRAFELCRNLTSVTIPNGVKNIGEEAFYGCTALKSVTLPNSVESIGSGAFEAAGLTNITIPQSVKEIGTVALGFYWNGNTYEYEKVPNFKISCYKGTEGEKYAKDKGFAYELLHSHSYTKVTNNIKPTCAKSGKIVKACSCGKTITTVVKATGKHVYKTVKTVKPTYTAEGYTLKKCSCGKTVKTNVKPKLILKNPARVITAGQKKKAVVKWSEVKDATGYKVWIKTSPNGKYTAVKALKERRLVKSGLKSGKTYYFAVKAYKKIGNKYIFSKATYKTVKVK